MCAVSTAKGEVSALLPPGRPRERAAPTPPGPELSRETAWSIGSQVTLPFLFAGLGLSGAGILLHYFQVGGDRWGCWG